MSFPRRLASLLETIYRHPYNRKRPFFALYRLLRWQADKRLRRGPIVYRFWKDRLAICYPDSEQTMWLVYHYVMDWEEFHLIADTLKPGGVAFDVGANIGSYMLWMSRFVKNGRIVCFEPDPKNFARCSDLVRLNRLEPVVSVERLALSDKKGALLFSQGRDRQNHLIPEGARPAGDALAVEAVTLDDYCAARGIERIDYLKMDVEGAELFVLRGARRLLEGRRIALIQFELNTQVEKYGIAPSALTDLLRANGFRICRYDVKAKRLRECAPEDYRENLFASLGQAVV
ncbi:MAG: hypothetical protein A3D28_02885 [Omnitrophica bacterium RIFCSPHIGHO2_02_FULL_63_14]|nr:MAG: hypothetical protein A3D28_02885 [Omnitrophica bacterium RIFCSPHIGHO2_02_FULL_63_14]